MKSKKYIFIIVMLIITAFNYKNTYSLSTPSIKVSKVVLENNKVLCLQINIVSIDYIESLVVEQKNTTNNKNSKEFVFDSNTKRATVYYYFYGEEVNHDIEFSLKLNNRNSKCDCERILKINDI